MKIIVNADDFGVSEEVNFAIDDLICKNRCSSTSLMVNMPLADKAVSLSRKNNYSEKVGLHLNLTQGIPLTDSIKKYNVFCDSNGTFNSKFHFQFEKFKLGKKQKKAVEKEIKAQIDKFLEYGLTLNYLNSHHHVHTNVSILKIILRLKKEYDIKFIRYSRNIYNKKEVSILKRIYKYFVNRMILNNTGVLINMGSYDDYFQFERMISGNSINEIMVHPKLINNVIYDDELPYSEIEKFACKHKIISFVDLL